MADQDDTPEQADPQLPPKWLDRHLWQIQPVRDVLVLLAVFGVFWLGYKLSVVTVPLLLAITLAYLFEPVIVWLTKRRWFSRQGAAAGIIAAFAFVVVVPIAVGLIFASVQAVQLAGSLASSATAIQQAVDRPDDEYAQLQVRGRIPIWIRDQILEAKARAAERAEDQPPAADDEPADEPNATPDDPVGETGEASSDPPAEDAEAGELAQSDELSDDRAADAPENESEIASENGAGVGDGEQSPPDTIVAVTPEDEAGEAMQLAIAWVAKNANAVTQRALQTGASAFDAFLRTVSSIAYIGFTLFLTAFFFYFVSSGYGKFLEFSGKFIPDDHREMTLDLLKKFDAVVSGFIRGRLTIAFIQSVVFSLGYWLIGVPAPVLLGVAVAVLSIVPYAALVGIPVSIALLWLESRTGFRGEIWWTVGAPVGFYFIGQALDDYVWTPLIQGKSTGMDTPTILFATLAGGALMGVYGLLLAIPLAACLKILLQEVFWPRFQEWIAGKQPDFLPISRD